MDHQSCALPKVHSICLRGIGQHRAIARDTPQMMSRKALCSSLTPEMHVDLTLETSEVASMVFEYSGRGISRDVLVSKGVVMPYGTLVALKISRAGKSNNKEEFHRLLEMRSRHLPLVYGFIPSMSISGQEHSILVVEAISISIDHQLADMKGIEPCAVAALFIEDILREGLLWLVGSWAGNGDQYADLHTGNLGLRMQYVQYCRLHEAMIRSQGVAPMSETATELGIVCLDAEAACRNRGRGRGDFNKGLKVFITDVSHAISMQFTHPFWQMYSHYVHSLLQVISDMYHVYEPMMLPTCHGHLLQFRSKWYSALSQYVISGTPEQPLASCPNDVSAVPQLCFCGYDRAACGACGQGWAQRQRQDLQLRADPSPASSSGIAVEAPQQEAL